MAAISQLHSMAEERTATSISLGRFVALLHRWAKRFCPDYNPCERKRLTGYPYLTQCETSAFLLWLESLPKHCFLSPDYPPVCFRKSSHISSSCSPATAGIRKNNTLMHLELIRLQYLPDRTLGTLHFVGDNQWHCDTLELPATINGETNVPNLCCITRAFGHTHTRRQHTTRHQRLHSRGLEIWRGAPAQPRNTQRTNQPTPTQ